MSSDSSLTVRILETTNPSMNNTLVLIVVKRAIHTGIEVRRCPVVKTSSNSKYTSTIGALRCYPPLLLHSNRFELRRSVLTSTQSPPSCKSRALNVPIGKQSVATLLLGQRGAAWAPEDLRKGSAKGHVSGGSRALVSTVCVLFCVYHNMMI